MDARSFFNTKGTPFPTFRYNQFGFSFGGPVWIPKIYHGKSRTFFFVDYEGFRRTDQVVRYSGVYHPAAFYLRRRGQGYPVRTGPREL
jgi:hypothetical protein